MTRIESLCLQVVFCFSAAAFGLWMIAGMWLARWMLKRAIKEVRAH